MQLDQVDSLEAHAANSEQIILCGTNSSINPSKAVILSMNFQGNVEWYFSIESVFEGKNLGSSRGKGVAINSNKDIAVSIEMETSIGSGNFDIYLVTIGQTLSRRKGVIVQSGNFNDQVSLSSKGLISGGDSYFFAGQANGYYTKYQSEEFDQPGSFVYRVDLDRNHACI